MVRQIETLCTCPSVLAPEHYKWTQEMVGHLRTLDASTEHGVFRARYFWAQKTVSC